MLSNAFRLGFLLCVCIQTIQAQIPQILKIDRTDNTNQYYLLDRIDSMGYKTLNGTLNQVLYMKGNEQNYYPLDAIQRVDLEAASMASVFVEGQVLNSQGEALDNVMLRLGTDTIFTAFNGRFGFNIQMHPNAIALLKVSKQGYMSSSFRFEYNRKGYCRNKLSY